jgi:hypothetical protein
LGLVAAVVSAVGLGLRANMALSVAAAVGCFLTQLVALAYLL